MGGGKWIQDSEYNSKNPQHRIDIAHEIDRYDWRLSNMDVLKDVYHSFIPRDVRHDFGEYYTPDWLAEAICEHVLDEAWCREAVARASNADDDLRGIGVLEPACGSGTFLRAAVNRLIPFAERVTKDTAEQSNIICRLIHGLDIHPVAVELARATMLSALPGLPTDGEAALNVFLADTLRLVTSTDMRLMVGDDVLIQTRPDPEGNPRDISLPMEVLLSSNFNSIIDDIDENSGRTYALEVRLDQAGFKRSSIEKIVRCAEVIEELKQEGKNHIWCWYIKNLVQPHRLMRSKLDRMVGNPPWITQNDLRGDRQAEHAREAKLSSVWVGGNQAPNNDLAALFVSSSSRDYMSRERRWKMGMILPNSALRSGQWAKFRVGKWHRVDQGASQNQFNADLSEPPWDLKALNERPFPQAHSCVVFAKRASSAPVKLSQYTEIWSNSTLLKPSMDWREISEYVTRETKHGVAELASDYLDTARRGADLFPISLILIEKGSIESGGSGVTRFRTRRSRHSPWKGKEQRAEVEEQCVRPAVRVDDIAPHRVFSLSHAIIPPDGVFQSLDPYIEIAKTRLFDTYWTKSESIWQQNRKSGTPQTLLSNIDHMRKLSTQISKKHPMRVVYPRSGANFFGACLEGSIIVDTGCYYIPVRNRLEADYLCALFGAPALSEAFKTSRKSDRDFHTYPLRTVPIPEFDLSNELHAELAVLGSQAAKVAEKVPLLVGTRKMRKAIREALQQDGISSQIDKRARQLLPEYATKTT